jgi:predicted pyridoxine 5'-phosphate oxidase superfamily flavin-nucleotide-binding protein
MSLKYLQLATTPAVLDAQNKYYGRARHVDPARPIPDDCLGPEEAAFIAARDSFYLGTVSETGWPYIQHRGGPPGFLHVLDAGKALAFADLGGNRQLLSTGNISAGSDRVALFLMDYPNRTRLKVNGHARILPADERPELTAALSAGLPPQARIERLFVIAVAAFDWNCPLYITPRYTEEQIAAAVAPLRARIAELEAQLHIPPELGAS